MRSSAPGKIVVSLDTSWQFREAGKESWHAATVPGCVHTDLLANKLIDDPFYRDNEKKLQWIDKTDWEYQATFKLTSGIIAREHIELVFEGLDTYAEVYLNENLLLKADNMFRTWRIDAKQALRSGENTLRVRFRSPINEILPVMAKLDYQLPSPNDQGEKTSPYTRKAPYHFGWDWGPRFVTSGIWRPVFLEVWDKARVKDLQIVTDSIADGVAHVKANVEIEASVSGKATVFLDNQSSRNLAAKTEVILEPGTNLVPLEFKVPRPALWWPHNLGKQPLYSFRARVVIDGRVEDQRVTRVGLRTVELRQQLDESGKSFFFVVNGVPVFAKGGNWIPADSFPTRVTKEKYRYLLNSVRDSNMNMVRVWGGGIYETEEFYNTCDEMGILVWQDFMFACTMYPGDQEFVENVRAEAIDNVKRLRNHPSIVIWTGNNEVQTAWMNWGWRQSLPASVWDDYEKIFHGVLPEVCSTYDPSRAYWSSSPRGALDDDPDSLRSGTMHFWKVWHAAEPFTEYQKQTPRFMSEYGFQSFPQIETVKAYTLPSDRDIESPIMLAHQRHPRGNQLIREYMLREYPEPKDFESFLYVSQVLQADGIRVGAEHLRRIMPHNMGSLYWQINDCWPVASWSSIDYYGRWKALQYYARRFYNNMLISPHVESGDLRLYVVSDQTEPTPAQINMALMDLKGNTLTNFKRDISVAPLVSRSYLEIEVTKLLQGRDPRNLIVHCELAIGDKVVSSNSYFFVPFKELMVSKPTITTNTVQTKDGFKITVSTEGFAKAVYLSVPDHDGFFSDNYFDLIPEKPIEVSYRSREPLSLSQLRQRLMVVSLVDAFD